MDFVNEYQPIRSEDLAEPPQVRIGVDIGQRVDPTAIVVVEAQLITPKKKHAREYWDQTTGDYIPSHSEVHFLARHVERRPLREAYPKIAARIVEVVEGVNARYVDVPGFLPDLLVDATGVGRPVIDVLRQELRYTAVRIAAVTFTAGSRIEPGPASFELRMGRRTWFRGCKRSCRQTRFTFPRRRKCASLPRSLPTTKSA